MLELTLIHVNEKGLDCIKIGKAWSIRVIRIRRFGNLSSQLHVSNSGTRTLFDWKCGVSVFHSCYIRIVWGLWSQSNFHDMIISIINIFWLHWIINRLVAMHPYALSHNKAVLKGAVSYRFSQGLLTLMCNNSKLKADINFFFFLLRRQTSKVYNWLQKFTIQHPVALL